MSDVAKKHDDLTRERLKPVELLHSKYPDKVDLALAEELGLIVEGTRDRIASLLPEHENLFRSSKNFFERSRGADSLKAFELAFDQVYWKFRPRYKVVEEGKNVLPKLIREALKFPIDNDQSLEKELEARPELDVLMGLLGEIESHKIKTPEIRELETKRGEFLGLRDKMNLPPSISDDLQAVHDKHEKYVALVSEYDFLFDEYNDLRDAVETTSFEEDGIEKPALERLQELKKHLADITKETESAKKDADRAISSLVMTIEKNLSNEDFKKVQAYLDANGYNDHGLSILSFNGKTPHDHFSALDIVDDYDFLIEQLDCILKEEFTKPIKSLEDALPTGAFSKLNIPFLIEKAFHGYGRDAETSTNSSVRKLTKKLEDTEKLYDSFFAGDVISKIGNEVDSFSNSMADAGERSPDEALIDEDIPPTEPINSQLERLAAYSETIKDDQYRINHEKNDLLDDLKPTTYLITNFQQRSVNKATEAIQNILGKGDAVNYSTDKLTTTLTTIFKFSVIQDFKRLASKTQMDEAASSAIISGIDNILGYLNEENPSPEDARPKLIELSEIATDLVPQLEKSLKTIKEGDFKDRIEKSKKKHAVAKVREARLRKQIEKSDKFYEKVREIMVLLDDSDKKGVDFSSTYFELRTAYREADPSNKNFTINRLLIFSDKLVAFLEDESNMEKIDSGLRSQISKFGKELDQAKENQKQIQIKNAERSKLTDSQAAMRVIKEILKTHPNFAEMEEGDFDDLVKLYMSQEMERIRNNRGFAELARTGSVDMSEAVNALLKTDFKRFKGEIIEFKYKRGEKTHQPFKGWKPENFADWDFINKKFNAGSLNPLNSSESEKSRIFLDGFCLLVTLGRIGEDNENLKGKHSEVYRNTELKLKELISKDLGVDERMNEAGVVKIVNTAFKDLLIEAENAVDEHTAHFEKERDDWEAYRVEYFKSSIKKLNNDYSAGLIDHKVYDSRREDLLSDAKKFGVDNEAGIFKDDMMAHLLYSKHGQWFRDVGMNVGHYVRKKAAAVGWSALKLGGWGLWGGTKAGASLLWNGSLGTLRSAIKYPAVFASYPLSFIGNGMRRIFGSQKRFTPMSLKENVKKDVGRVWEYTKDASIKNIKGAGSRIGTVPVAEWNKDDKKYPWERKFAERKKDEIKITEDQVKEFEEKAEHTPIELPSSSFIDMGTYRTKIEQLNKILAA